MKKFILILEQKAFQFEYEDGYIWLLENKNSFTNFGQVRMVSNSEAKKTALQMLYALGKIKRIKRNQNLD